MREMEERLAKLVERGVIIVDSRQTHVHHDVDFQRLQPGCVLHPGTRLQGPRTFVGRRAEVGHEGPATLHDSVLDQDARIASGYARGAVLLERASAGANAHIREGTVLEEDSSTAHCVGLKHTTLLPFVTLGSLVNLCDVLVAGGSSRRDHSEIGSGFIHFNFTPWGERGDKATASLFGDAVHGVFLRQARIFVGGVAGVVGPRSIGFGSVVGAGQVVRRDVGRDRLVVQPTRGVDRPWDPTILDPVEDRSLRNIEFMAQLAALLAWYRAVRIPRATRLGEARSIAVREAESNLQAGLEERYGRLNAFLQERGWTAAAKLELPPIAPCPLPLDEGPEDHISWIRSLSEHAVRQGVAWLSGVADEVRAWGSGVGRA